MKRLMQRLWFLWRGYGRLDLAWARIEALERQNGELRDQITALSGVVQQHRSEIVGVIQSVAADVNALRSNLPAVLTQAPPPRVRRAGWGEFRAAAENPRRMDLPETLRSN